MIKVNLRCYIFVFLFLVSSLDVMASDFFPVLKKNDECQKPGAIILILENTWADKDKLYGKFKIYKNRPILDKEIFLSGWENMGNNFVSASIYFRPLNSDVELMFSNETYQKDKNKYILLKDGEEPRVNIDLSSIKNIHNVGNWFVVFRQEGLCFRSFVFNPEGGAEIKGYKTIDVVEHEQANNFSKETVAKILTQDEIISLECAPEYFTSRIIDVIKNGKNFKGRFLFKNEFKESIKIKGKRYTDEFLVDGLSYARVLGLKKLVAIDIGDKLFPENVDMLELKAGQEFVFSMELPSEFFANHSDFWIIQFYIQKDGVERCVATYPFLPIKDKIPFSRFVTTKEF